MIEEIKKAGKEAWSIENMAGHGAEGRQVTYIGSEDCGDRIFEYYKDEEGDYWYKVKLRLQDGRIIDRSSLFPRRKRHAR